MKNTIKYSVLLMISFCAFLIKIQIVEASTSYGVVTASGGLNVRRGAGTNHNVVGTVDFNQEVVLVSTILHANQQGCSAGWYNIYYTETSSGYVCASYLTIYQVTSGERKAETEYEKYLEAQGFPVSYWDSLIALNKKYPNWNFKADLTGRNWNTAVARQSDVGVSLMQTNNQGWRSTAGGSYNWRTNTWTVKEGSNWYAADSRVVAYYLDPRNWLTENRIFQFEQLKYEAKTQTEEGVRAVFGTSSYLSNHVQTFMRAATTYDVNPVYLASRVRKEVGLTVGTATSGAPFSYNGVSYAGFYNVYNIGATTGTNPVLTGLYWASGSGGQTTTYQRPWNSIEKSILGGAEYINERFVKPGQDTGYFQRFNVASYTKTTLYRNQYMTNIQAVADEAVTTYSSYNSGSMLPLTFDFIIPVYVGMPASPAKLPNIGNPNNRLDDLKVNGVSVTGFSHDIPNYTVYVNSAATSVTIAATAIVNTSSIKGTGNVNLNRNTSVLSIDVTAQNGDVQTYSITVIKTDNVAMTPIEIISNMAVKTDGTYISGIALGTTIRDITNLVQKVNPSATVSVTKANKNADKNILATDDKIRITSGGTSTTLTIVITGDASGDGIIDVQDLLVIQKHILGTAKISGAKLKAGDSSRDNIVNVQDLLVVQKDILGKAKINQ